MNTTDTIVALATAQGIGALAVIRVSGDDAIAIVKSSIVEKEKFEKASERIIGLYQLINTETKEVIDQITAIKYYAPRSYTGEQMVEMLCHGGDVTAERILECLVDKGVRYAAKGEFTKRAFLNGKTSLTKAESINQIVNSKTVMRQKGAVYNYLGGYETQIKSWKEDVEDLLMGIEAAIEFGEDDDMEKRESEAEVRKKAAELKKNIQKEIKKREILKEIDKGVHVAIVGPINAGKSSLFNLIIGYERSIVDTEEGTTRDFISEDRKIGDIRVRFIDTAGLREVSTSVEKKGIERSWEFIDKSRALIWVSAANEKMTKEELNIKTEEGRKILGIINKVDLSDGSEKEKFFKKKNIPYIKISAINNKERVRVESFIVDQVKEIYKGIEYNCIIGNKRQEKIIEEIVKDIEDIEENSSKEELVAEHCKNILEKIEEFVGKATSEEILDKIFNEFCIGK